MSNVQATLHKQALKISEELFEPYTHRSTTAAG